MTPSTNKCQACTLLKMGKTISLEEAPHTCKPTESSVCGVAEYDTEGAPFICQNPKPCSLHEKPSVCEHDYKDFDGCSFKMCHKCGKKEPQNKEPVEELRYGEQDDGTIIEPTEALVYDTINRIIRIVNALKAKTDTP